MRARVSIRLRPDVLDPQGKAIGQALVTLGFLVLIMFAKASLSNWMWKLQM